MLLKQQITREAQMTINDAKQIKTSN